MILAVITTELWGKGVGCGMEVGNSYHNLHRNLYCIQTNSL